jgi:hypothetical protein
METIFFKGILPWPDNNLMFRRLSCNIQGMIIATTLERA